ncbi:DUF1329 domain-containing protein [Alcanivorax sp. JB21]|uniref:DUF1329 domain-containing protein n=1 Tax=Alcanivorax limicola TaxID=2874102 RepID=UPI001CBC8AC1|nr:DUF1329 domain-containing protein [Alcanivorax limicola]MBZ2188069.1 DUF1329 domain-containing protein [Alcanivorax limicola]
MLNKTIMMGGVVALALTLSTGAQAAVSAQEAAKLGDTLTAFGAPKAGNGVEAGSPLAIPAWRGFPASDKPSAYTRPGQHHPDPFPNDKVLLTINNDNKAEYAERLPLGVKALMETYPETFHINVYQSRRTTSAPDWVYDNTKKNASSAQLGDSGVSGAFGGIPFPILHGNNEEQARQAIWNHILRWRGQYVVRRASEVAVQRNGRYTLVTSQQEVYFRYYNPELSEAQLDNIIFYFISETLAPARLAGGAVLVHETLDQQKLARQAWGYNEGTRRVQRSPNVAYDQPISAADGLRTADDTDMYNGALDRYDWRLVHDEPVEMFIPYNNYRLDSPDLEYSDILLPGHVNPDHTRWELHRVWVVDATLKSGQRHIYERRTFYIDADSWQVAVADQYDRRGEMWRVSLAHIKNFYEVPTQWTAMDVFHDLRSRRYHVQQLTNEASHNLIFDRAYPGDSHFSPAGLRRRGN